MIKQEDFDKLKQMNKSRTLKEIGEVTKSGAFICNYNELKQKTIKWFKEDKRRIKQGNINVNILLRKWMVRLNIFEEDLK